MPTAKEVASEIRKLADHLDTIGDATITKPNIWFYTWKKEELLRNVQCIPRPIEKKYDDDRIRLKHENLAIEIEVIGPRNAVCKIIKPAQPAVYECDPLLSLEEESNIAGE